MAEETTLIREVAVSYRGAQRGCVPGHSGAGTLHLQHHSPCPPDAYPTSHQSIPRHSLGLSLYPLRRELGDDRIPRSEEHFIRSLPSKCGVRRSTASPSSTSRLRARSTASTLDPVSSRSRVATSKHESTQQNLRPLLPGTRLGAATPDSAPSASSPRRRVRRQSRHRPPR